MRVLGMPSAVAVFVWGLPLCATPASLFAEEAPAEEPSGGAAPAEEAPAAASEEAPAEAAAEASAEAANPVESQATHGRADALVDGYLKTRYRLRESGDDRDQDLYQYLRLDVNRIGTGHLSAHAYGRVTWDIEGEADAAGFYVFDNINDTNDTAVDERLYLAYLDGERLGPVEQVRAGRQMDLSAPTLLYFDGVSAKTRSFRDLAGLRLGVLGGVPVHLYEGSRSGDLIAGGWATASPWQGGRVQLFGIHVDDENVYGSYHNDQVAATVWQRLDHGVNLRGEYTMLRWRPQSAEVAATWLKPEWDLMLQGTAFALLRTLDDLAIEFDPYYVSLREQHPYGQLRLLADQGVGDYVRVQGGVNLRRLVNHDDESAFNHDLLQAFVAATADDLGVEGLNLSVDASLWDTRFLDQRIATVGGSVGYELGERLDVSLGTSWAAYQYDLYSDAELDDVRTWYGRLRSQPFKKWRGEVRYTFEDAAERSFHTVNLSLRYDL